MNALYIFGISIIVLLVGILAVYIIKIVKDNKQSELIMQQQTEELACVYKQLAAQEEELRQNFKELYLGEEKIRENEDIYRLVAEGSNDGLWITDILQGTITLTPRVQNMMAISQRSISTDLWKQHVHPEDLPLVQKLLEDHLSGSTPVFSAEYRIKMADGGYHWVLSRGKAMFDNQGKPNRMAGSFTDINEHKSKEEKIRHMAYYDSLTGLANRQLLTEIVCEVLATSTGKGNIQGALFFIDLDNFKMINDTYGHSLGDKVLVKISGRIANFVYGTGIAARLGGDELIVFLPNMSSREAVIAYADKLMEVFEQSVAVDEHTFHLTASAGIVLYPDHGTTGDELFRNADIAMYSAKNSGKRTYMIFDKDMHDVISEKMRLEAKLWQILDKQELSLFYQPQVNLVTGRVESAEALIRWENPQDGMVSPLKFIPLAEETGLIVEIGYWVLEKACTFVQQLYLNSHRRVLIAVNVSVVQLMQEDFVERVARVLAKTGLPSKYLEMEITESILMERFGENAHKLAELRRLGVRIALDDFGSGYSSLTYLKKLPITALKMDKAFIDDIASGGVDAAITGSIIDLAHKMNLIVVAEGVETEKQRHYLAEKHCDIIQGYLISPPLSQEEFVDKLMFDWR